MFPADGADADTLFRNAETAVKRAKAGGERLLFYTEAMTERVAEKLNLENKLRDALEKDLQTFNVEIAFIALCLNALAGAATTRRGLLQAFKRGGG